MTVIGSRKHPDEFVGRTVAAYPTCGPRRMRRVTVEVLRYDPESDMAYMKAADGTEMMVPNSDWTVDADVSEKSA